MIAAALMISASTVLFQGVTKSVTGSAFKKTDHVPADYAAYGSGPPQPSHSRLPEGYVEANYRVGEIDLESYRSQTPANKDMTKEAAAEIGAQALWEIYGVSLEGQTIEMGYQQANESVPRSRWYADVVVDGERKYSFSVDSVTGELFTIGFNRVLEEEVSVDFDAALDKHPEEYEALAKALAEKYNIVRGAVQSARYNGQGYINNDPSISVEIVGQNGQVALMTFSRYDKALLGISYPPEYKSALEYAERWMKRIQEMKEESDTPYSGRGEVPALMKILEWKE